MDRSNSLTTLLEHCARCGACKARCPSYAIDPHEAMSARGRLELLRQFETNSIGASRLLRYRMNTCVHCGLCDTSCPVRLDIQEILFQGKRTVPAGQLLRDLSRCTLTPKRMDFFFALARFGHLLAYRPLRRFGGYRYVPRPSRVPFRKRHTLFRESEGRGRVALFVGCSLNYLYPEIAEDLLDILIMLGFEVVIRRGEVCCGAPLRELGFHAFAEDLARRNVETFTKMRVDAILSACPTCTMTLKHQYPKIVSAPKEFYSRIRDVNEFLAQVLDVPLARSGTVAYHDPCHLANSLSIREEPRRLIRASGAVLSEETSPSPCCGFGGTFGFRHPDMSRQLGASCVEQILPEHVPVLITACPGCKMQFEDILLGTEKVVLHSVQFLRQAMGGGLNEDAEPTAVGSELIRE